MREAEKRDAALDLLREHRRELIEKARSIAVELAKKAGTVTSTEVLSEMTARGIVMGDVDRRFMGAVFKGGPNKWERASFAAVGSHCRPVSVWRLAA